jgi:hypothetical protein
MVRILVAGLVGLAIGAAAVAGVWRFGSGDGQAGRARAYANVIGQDFGGVARLHKVGHLTWRVRFNNVVANHSKCVVMDMSHFQNGPLGYIPAITPSPC